MQKKYWKHILGQQAEDGACRYLQKKGLKFITRNFRCRMGEIDLIMQDGKILTFIEVRLRSNLTYGSGLESVTMAKQRKIIRTAEYYLLEKHLVDKIPCRFDVVSVSYHKNQWDYFWVKQAFEDYQ